MASMLAAERRNKIAEILVANGSIKIKEMSEMFSVSTETIRKDLIYLNKIGVAQKSHGGALSSLELIEKPLEDRENKNSVSPFPAYVPEPFEQRGLGSRTSPYTGQA